MKIGSPWLNLPPLQILLKLLINPLSHPVKRRCPQFLSKFSYENLNLFKFLSTFSGKSEGLMGPAVRLLLDLYRIDTAKIPHSGPKSSLLKRLFHWENTLCLFFLSFFLLISDVMGFITQNQLKPQPYVEERPKVAPASEPKRVTPAITPAVTTLGQASVDLPLSNVRKTIAKRLSQSKVSHYLILRWLMKYLLVGIIIAKFRP